MKKRTVRVPPSPKGQFRTGMKAHQSGLKDYDIPTHNPYFDSGLSYDRFVELVQEALDNPKKSSEQRIQEATVFAGESVRLLDPDFTNSRHGYPRYLGGTETRELRKKVYQAASTYLESATRKLNYSPEQTKRVIQKFKKIASQEK